MASIIEIKDLTKTYEGGFTALNSINLSVEEGEILALLGPNGAGKTTLISTICGITLPSSGSVTVGGYDTMGGFREARGLIGLVPQDLTIEPFETVHNTVSFSRGLFGKPRNPQLIEEILRSLSLWDKKDNQIRTLSGGMKRRVLIAKALSHEPKVLFLDEPSAGVDVELRKDMWNVVRGLSERGVTIILTTHYIEEAEEMAHRVAVINKGEILLVEEKSALMQKLGRKELQIELQEPLDAIPAQLKHHGLRLSEDGSRLHFEYDTKGDRTGITTLLSALSQAGIRLRDIETRASSLEDIFVTLVKDNP